MKYLYVFSLILFIHSCSQITSFSIVKGPLHASCKINWTWADNSCEFVQQKIVQQIQTWTGEAGCENGTEKCLYKLVSQSATQIKATHETPVKHYVDDLTFTFSGSGQMCNCFGFSTSETWYAVLDFGTNYCNLNNLINGAGLDKLAGYTEVTNDNICTQYSSRNCSVY